MSIFRRRSASPSPPAGSPRRPVDLASAASERLRAEGLEPGATVTLVLGGKRKGDVPRRVVRGSVRGFAVRGEQEWGFGHWIALDLILDHITTWMRGPVPLEAETLPPDFSSTFAVEVFGTVASTVAMLRDGGERGRLLLNAAEHPWACCPACGGGADRRRLSGAAFCPDCGARASVGYPLSLRPTTSGLGRACGSCWHPRQSGDVHCRHCGVPHASPVVPALEGMDGEFLLTEGGRRLGRLRGRLSDVRLGRVEPRGREQITATLTVIEAISGKPLLDEAGSLPPAFRTGVTVHVDWGGLEELPDRIARGEAVRVSELKARCVCGVSGDQGPFILDRYCGPCGKRMRLVPHPEAATRRTGTPRTRTEHVCGATIRRGRDVHCPSCGEEVGSHLERRLRFARIG